MSTHLEKHYILSISAIVLAIILLIMTFTEPIHDISKITLELIAHLITFYVSIDIISQYCKNKIK